MRVAYGRAEISVPGKWYILYGTVECPVGHPAGEVFVNPSPGVVACPIEVPPLPATVVELAPIRVHTGPIGRALWINGILVVPVGGTYLVPSLDVQVTVSGPLGLRVLHTLTTSPRDIALAGGPVPAVPPSWRRLSFVGVSVALPRAWPVTRTSFYGPNCSPLQAVEFLGTARALFDTDQKLIVPMCPYIPPYGYPQSPSNGLRIDKVTAYPPVSQSTFHWCLSINGLTVCPAASPAYSILVLKATGPSLSKPVYVSIGLAGDGMVARTILFSLRAA